MATTLGVVWRLGAGISVGAAPILAGGCAGREGEQRPAPVTQPSEAGGRPAALIDGEPISWATLQPLLAESSGGSILQELTLDRRLARELGDRGVVLSQADIARERDLLARTLARQGGGSLADPAEADRVIGEMRRSRGLGDVRFAALLRRSAALRLLVQRDVDVSDDAVRLAHAVRYGPRVRVRLIVLPTQAQAAEVLGQLATAPPGELASRFGELARTRSTDSSGPRGGAIEPFSVEDPAYPVALRQAAAGLAPLGLAPVVAMDRGYGVMMLEDVLPAAGVPIESVGEELRAEVRLRQERVLMDRLAASLIGRPGVSVLDRSLAWSWGAVAPAGR